MFRQAGTTLGQGSVSTGRLPVVVDVVNVPVGVVTGGAGGRSVLGGGTGGLSVPGGPGGPGGRTILVVLVTTLVWVSVTGQMVVEMGTVTMTVVAPLPGQTRTSGPQLVMVETTVVKMVEVLWNVVTVV